MESRLRKYSEHNPARTRQLTQTGTLTVKQSSSTSRIIGRGAKGPKAEFFQHSGGGALDVSGFYVSDFGKIYRSCRNCVEQTQRTVSFDNVVAESGPMGAGIIVTAPLSNCCFTDFRSICGEFEGNNAGDEPEKGREDLSDA